METSVEIEDHQGRAGEVRRAVGELARQHGMNETETGRAALVGTEIATNLAKYGKRGTVSVDWVEEGGAEGLQIVAADHGPGIPNWQAAVRDGYSTGGSLGLGLGVLTRTADHFEAYAPEGRGAAFLARIYKGGRKPEFPQGRLVHGSRSLPKHGQELSGDAWSAKRAGRLQRFCMIDGLGHGPLAASAAAEGVKVFQAAMEQDAPGDIILRAHPALKSTRGVVMAVADIDTAAGRIAFSGVGNITGVVITGGQAQHLMSVEGIVGFNMRTVRPHEYAWDPQSVLVLASDGLSSRFSLEPELLARHPALIAAVLFRDHARDSDDATVLVARRAA